MKKLVFVSLLAAGGLFAYAQRGEANPPAEEKTVVAAREECCPCAIVTPDEGVLNAQKCCKCY